MFTNSVIYVLLLVYLSLGHYNAEQLFKIGAIFDQKSEELRVKAAGAFLKAINDINELNYNFKFEGIARNIEYDNAYQAMEETCMLLEEGVIGIFGPVSEENSNVVQSICDLKEIPHIEMRWDDHPLNGTIVNVYPYPDVLTRTYIDIIEEWGWRDFVILYENNESLQRVGELLKLFIPSEHRIVVRQISSEDADLRVDLKELWRSRATHFVLDCTIETLEKVLRYAQQVGLMTSEQHYIITNLDLHTIELEPYLYSETNVTGMRFVDPDNSRYRMVSAAILGVDEELAGWKLRLEEALTYDAVMMFAEAIKAASPIKNAASISCLDNDDIYLSGTSVINFMKNLEYEGLTGRVKFDIKGFRTHFGLDITELKEGGVIKVASWNSTAAKRLTNLRVIPEVPSKGEYIGNMTFTVITTLTEPYGMEKVSTENLQGNDRYEGFAIDLIHELSLMRGFNYTFIIGKETGTYDNDTKTWSGMIGDLINEKADLAITDLTITYERETAVDFTSPFMMLGIGILYQKPTTAPPGFFTFADPFAFEVWSLLMVACVGVSLVLFVLGRISSSEWENPYPCIEEPEYLVNQLDLRNCFWFMTGSIMQQGSEIELKSVATRMVAGMWWFFTLLMVSSYTANLAAFLTTENPDPHFTNFKELIQNAPKKGIDYGAKAGGATANFFRDKAKDQPGSDYAKAWAFMEANAKRVMMKTNKEAVDKVDNVENIENQRYAFFMESSSIEYETQRRCNLDQVGGLLDEKGYGIAMRKNAFYRNSLSTAILQLQNSGKIDEIKRRWWQERRGGGQCMAEDSDTDAKPLNLDNVKGVFWVTISGAVLAFFLAIIETVLHTAKRSVKTKTPFSIALKEEFKFILKFDQMVKPVFNNSTEGSASNKFQSEEKELPYDLVKKTTSVETLESCTNSNKSKRSRKRQKESQVDRAIGWNPI